MLNVSDIMSHNVLTLDARLTARHAAEAFTENGISGAPVVDEGRVVGVISKTDLVRGTDRDVCIRDLMTPLVHFVRPDDSAQHAVDLLLEERIHRLVVMGPNGTVAGMLTPSDVLRVERRHALRYPSIWPHGEAAHAIPEDGDFF